MKKGVLPPDKCIGKKVKIYLDAEHYTSEYVIGTCVKSRYWPSSYMLKDITWSNGNAGQGYFVVRKAFVLYIEVCDKVVTPDSMYDDLLLE